MDKHIPESVEIFVKEEEMDYIKKDLKNTLDFMILVDTVNRIKQKALRANRIVGTALILIGILSAFISEGDITALIFLWAIGILLLFAKEGCIIGFSEKDYYMEEYYGQRKKM